MNIGRKLRRQTGGASIAEYALLIGLLGTTALVAISQVGGTAGNGIEHAGQVIAENAGSKKGHPGQGNPGNPGNGNPGNGNPGEGDPGDGGNQPEPVTTVAPDQSFDFDGYVGPGETVGTVVTEGEPPKGFELVSGGEGLQIDNSGRITIVDPGTFGPVETTKPVTVRIIPVGGPAAEGVIEVKRSTPVDLANDATTKGRLIIGTPKKNDIGTGDPGDWIAVDTETMGDIQILVRGMSHDGAAMTLPIVTLRDEQGKILATSGRDLTNLAAIVYNDLPVGKYFIEVTKHKDGLPGGYVVETAFVDDAGNLRSNSDEMAFGSTIESSIIYGDEGDMWKVVVPRKTHVQFKLDTSAGAKVDNYAYLTVFDSGGIPIKSNLAVASHRISAILLNDMEPGTYYVRADGTGGHRDFDYQLSVTEHADDHPSNIATSGVIELTELFTGEALNVRPKPQRGSVVMGDPSDWYRIEVDEQTDIQVHVDRVSGDHFGFGATLRNSTGGVIATGSYSAFDGGDLGNRFLFQNLAPGTYFITVYKAMDYTRQENVYDISARKIRDAPNTRAQADTYNLWSSVKGRIDYGENTDIYRFETYVSGTYTLSTHRLGISSAQFGILDSTGKTVARTSAYAKAVTADLVGGQTYYVEVVSSHRGDYGFTFAPESNWVGEFPEWILDYER